MNVRNDIEVPPPDGEDRRHPLHGLGIPCDKEGWTPMELLFAALNNSFEYIRIFGLRSINRALRSRGLLHLDAGHSGESDTDYTHVAVIIRMKSSFSKSYNFRVIEIFGESSLVNRYIR